MPTASAPTADPVSELEPRPASRWNAQRDRIEHYFDRTASKAWEALTSDAPVSRVRANVRAGRDEMRTLLLSWLPGDDLHGMTLLDAGCGTGALAVEAARRGATVLGVDVSPELIRIARERLPSEFADRVRFEAGDMLSDTTLGTGTRFDGIVAMDSLIHYDTADAVQAYGALGGRLVPAAHARLLATFVPSNPLLELRRAVGNLFPRQDRSPMLAPVREQHLRERLGADPACRNLGVMRTQRVSRGFYTSQAIELATAARAPA